MSERVVIEVENLSKFYRLGTINGDTLREDLARWWAKTRGRPEPTLKIGEQDHGNRNSERLWALRDVSFQVREGEVLGLIGRNGAGKSTLLKILSKITAPTSGRAVIRGRVGSLLEVGTGFHPELTGRENIYLNGAILGMSRKETKRKIDDIILFSEMSRFIDTPVKRYSSGMTVRLAFAVAAHLEPDILIIDEVLAVGDADFQRRCVKKMQEVAGEGRTVLVVSHIMNTIKELCSRALLFRSGRVELDSNVNEVVNRYTLVADHEHEPIARRLDRGGNGLARLVRVNMKVSREDCFGQVRENLEVTLYANGCIDGALIGIYRRDGILVSDLDSRQRTLTSEPTGEGTTATVKASLSPFLPGDYYLNVALFKYGEMQDHLTKVAFFTIKERSEMGSLVSATARGYFHVHQEWFFSEELGNHE